MYYRIKETSYEMFVLARGKHFRLTDFGKTIFFAHQLVANFMKLILSITQKKERKNVSKSNIANVMN